jgi:cell division protein FtsA
VIGERTEKGILEITGVGLSPSTGLRKGVVVNIEATLRSVSQAIEAAEMMSGREVHSCWTGIGGSHIDGINSRGVVAVTGKNRETREIGREDIARVLEAARAVVIPMDRRVLEVIPQSYIVDDQKGIADPLDMIGVRLESEVHIITCSVTSAENLIKCVNRAGFRVNDLILQSLAAGRSVLTGEEKELGVALIDLGGGLRMCWCIRAGLLIQIPQSPRGAPRLPVIFQSSKIFPLRPPSGSSWTRAAAGRICWRGMMILSFPEWGEGPPCPYRSPRFKPLSGPGWRRSSRW